MSDNQHAAVHSIGHYALIVPGLEEARQFHTSFGLSVIDHGDRLDATTPDDQVWARFFPGERRELAYLSFHCFEADYEGLRGQIEAAGGRPADNAPHASGIGIWFHDPDGNLIQVRVGPKTSPFAKPAIESVHVGSDARGALFRHQVPAVRPRRLSHVALFTPDLPRALAFYNRALGLRLSDRSGDLVAFTHAPHGSDHHLVAFASSPAKGWHHASWDVASVDQVGQGAAQMAAAGYVEGWGTGRHVLGSNFFHYVRDPWGSFCEYSADMDYISAGTTWPAGDHAPEDSMHQWGPAVPPWFGLNTEA
ncbi:VOC family protein [Cupriavidus agavae]|uniref:Catechol 2,3-dioxygenase n=1 Tax=Cupriavidus agavae TaxID=1001822 RepID=A0A4Q7RVK3_9BURK|nr:VOC family protein [Cupriavidus agavae]RZT36858.1 catechol 2,3-dioxygenase [Cupriavidus agavae]